MRFVLAASAALLAVPAAAQTPQESDIVVSGSLERPSDWRVAETDHVVVLSDGGQSELTRIAHNLERLHFLLSVLLDRAGKNDSARKLRITLVGDRIEFNAMELRNLRARQGPYVPAFAAERYYDPREDGAVMAATRFDRKAVLEQGADLAGVLRGLQLDTGPAQPGLAPTMFSDLAAATRFGAADPLAISVNELAVPIAAEGRIYAGFAQHYLLTYLPQAYPRWFVDGFGEVFATIVTRQDGSLDYGRPPEGYAKVLGRYASYPVRDVVTGNYLDDRKARARWTPFHAWALTHMLFFSEARRPQLSRYLAAIAAGQTPEQAAAAFGDLAALQRELTAYDNHKVPYERITYPPALAAEPLLRRLSQGQAAFLKGRLELGSRVEIPSPPSPGLPPADAARIDKARGAAIAARDAWLMRLRKDAARYRNNVEAQLLLAEAECRSGNSRECAAAADAALALSPANSDALSWQGTAMVQQALALPPAARGPALKAARITIARANRADTESPLPLLAYYRSFADAGAPAPDIALEGLLKAVDAVPAAPAPRLLLGEAFARADNPTAAQRALRPVADGAYDSPERGKARAVLETLQRSK